MFRCLLGGRIGVNSPTRETTDYRLGPTYRSPDHIDKPEGHRGHVLYSPSHSTLMTFTRDHLDHWFLSVAPVAIIILYAGYNPFHECFRPHQVNVAKNLPSI